jgi:hypothetical protein
LVSCAFLFDFGHFILALHLNLDVLLVQGLDKGIYLGLESLLEDGLVGNDGRISH